MYKRIINFLLIFLVFVYIIFEELIWDKFAKPIISYISNFSLFKNLIPKILALNSYIILIIFKRYKKVPKIICPDINTNPA